VATAATLARRRITVEVVTLLAARAAIDHAEIDETRALRMSALLPVHSAVFVADGGEFLFEARLTR